jgi:hypothetical protein
MRFIFPGLFVLSFLEHVCNIYVSDFGAFAPSTVFVRALQIPRNLIQPFFHRPAIWASPITVYADDAPLVHERGLAGPITAFK